MFKTRQYNIKNIIRGYTFKKYTEHHILQVVRYCQALFARRRKVMFVFKQNIIQIMYYY